MVLGNPMEEMLLSQAMHDKQVTARKRRRAGTGGPCPCLDLEVPLCAQGEAHNGRLSTNSVEKRFIVRMPSHHIRTISVEVEILSICGAPIFYRRKESHDLVAQLGEPLRERVCWERRSTIAEMTPARVLTEPSCLACHLPAAAVV